MIQILGLREFPSKKSGKNEKKEVFFAEGWRANTLQELFSHPGDILQNIPQEQHWNLYFTVADCLEEPGRKLKEQWAIPFDIDDILIEKAEETARVALGAMGLAWEQTAVLFSGGGVQFFVGLVAPITNDSYFDEQRTHYRTLCNIINAALEKAGLPGKADPSVWSPARLMRMPQTENRKPGREPRTATVLQPNLIPIDFSLQEAAGSPFVDPRDQVSPEVLKRFPEPDTDAVFKECGFLSWCKAEPAKVQEPQWYAMLSVVGRLPKGREIAHEVSKGHPGYSESETDIKLEQATSSSGPRTCKNIATLFPGCAQCKYYDTNLASPILIKGPDYIKTKSTGFHDIRLDKDGNPKPGKPNYDDLRKFFEQKNTFITMEGSRLIYTFNGNFWEECPITRLEAFAQQYFLPLPDAKMRSEFVKLIQCSNLRPEGWLGSSVEKKMNLQNGVLDLETLELKPHSPEYGFRFVLPYSYDPGAQAPRFEQFLREVTQNDVELQNVLTEFMGFALSYDSCWMHKALILFGEGANGKSTFLDILRAIAGEDNCSNLSLKGLNSDTKRYLLDGKLVNIGEENSVNSLADSEIFKVLIGGGLMLIKKLFVQEYEVRNRCKLVLSCNELPTSNDKTDGLYRRMLLVPFRAKFEGDQRDPLILDKLKQELPGILNIIITGYRRLHEQGRFTDAKISSLELEGYRELNDNVIAWEKEFLTVTGKEEDYLQKNELYSSYTRYCEEEGEKPVTSKRFFMALKHLNLEEARHMESGKFLRIIRGVQLANNSF